MDKQMDTRWFGDLNLPPEQAKAAALNICGRAKSVQDALLLLTMVGLR